MSVVRFFQYLLFSVIVSIATKSNAATAEGLEKYIQQPDTAFRWKVVSRTKTSNFTIIKATMTSQKWRGTNWTHEMLIVRPETLRNSDIAFLFVGGSETPSSHLSTLKLLAQRAGAVTAIIGDVPNQPAYGGLVEDALIAYTFDQFVRTRDDTWPLLFPMVKSAVRGLDTIDAVTKREFGQDVSRFVVSGASKRGWTTWLTGAVDKRVVGIAPMVFDMLNMKAQTAWSDKVYGKQSHMIHDYTDAQLVQRMDQPRVKELREWVDPYAYRSRYTIPKLILLGTNDPYWTVDSLRHYWSDLPEPKLIYQTPNAGHDLGGGEQAVNTLAAFFETIAAREELPIVQWKFENTPDQRTEVRIDINQKATSARLWSADSADRDFRNEHWSDQPLKVKSGSAHAETAIMQPKRGYRAFLVETELKSPSGHPYKVSTEAKVVPDLQ